MIVVEKKEKWILFLSILLVIMDVVLCFELNRIPKITLIKEDIQLPLGSTYQEPGYKVTLRNQDYSSYIQIKNTINPDKVGEYEVTYTVLYHHKKYQKKRKVTIVDEEKPSIVLKGSAEVSICPNADYIEEGYQAFDNYDGDLTDQVKVEKKDNEIIYSVEDKSSNEFIVSRKIKKEDTENPVITLIGNTTITLYTGTTYEEAGYQVTDNCDTNLIDKVVTSHDINLSIPGTYHVTYTVEDSSGNQTSITREVKVVKPISGTGKVIYLTFDDGPSSTITPGILDILKEENVKATFFVIHHSPSLDYLIKRAHDEGHTVALHSYSHNYRQIYSSGTDYFADLYAIQTQIKNITGVAPNIIRFPGGSSNTVSRFNPGIMSYLTQEVTKKGFTYFDWNVGSGDSGEAHTKEEVYQNVTQSLGSKNNVVLMHDFENNYKTLNALRDIIRYGKKHGYTFLPITETTPIVHHRVAN